QVAVSHVRREYSTRSRSDRSPTTGAPHVLAHRATRDPPAGGRDGKREEEGAAPRQGKPEGGVSPRANYNVAKTDHALTWRSAISAANSISVGLRRPDSNHAHPHETVKTHLILV